MTHYARTVTTVICLVALQALSNAQVPCAPAERNVSGDGKLPRLTSSREIAEEAAF